MEVWNQWRKKHPDIFSDLSEVDLRGADLSKINLSKANLSEANLTSANLTEANLFWANLTEANLFWANLSEANLTEANLTEAHLLRAHLTRSYLSKANLSKANLFWTDLSESDLGGTHFTSTRFWNTFFVRVDLNNVKGLEAAVHEGPSTVNINSVVLPHDEAIRRHFLRGVGFTETQIDYLPSLLIPRPIEYQSLFISYSSKDQEFAKRLYADLRKKDVPCWFAPEDLKIGDKFRVRIDESIRLYDKLLLVLSEHSLASNWVAYEVEKALNKEPEGVPNVLFPIRLDKTILTCETDWAKDIRKSRHIGDFEYWKDHDAYQQAFQRLLRDLKAQSQQ